MDTSLATSSANADVVPLQNLEKPVGPSYGILDKCDERINAHVRDPKNKWDKFPLRPSAAGYCSRRLGYDLMEFRGLAKYDKEYVTPDTFKLLNLGHSVEYSELKNLELCKEDFKIKYKQQVVTLFKLDGPDAEIIEGSIDAALWSEEWKGIIDVKSAKDAFNAAYKTRWDETLDKYANMASVIRYSDKFFYIPDLEAFLKESGDPFLYDNFMQLNSYCLSPFFQTRGCEFASIIKVNKNDSRDYELRFKPSWKLFADVQTKFNLVNNSIGQHNPDLIPRDYMYGSMRCAFCPYKKECWGQDGDALKEWFKSFPPKEWPQDINEDAYPDLADMFKLFVELEDAGKEKDKIEEKLVSWLYSLGITKVRLADGHIYIMKQLKEGPVLRRSKL